VLLLPALHNEPGESRFTLPVARDIFEDLAIKYLIERESLTDTLMEISGTEETRWEDPTKITGGVNPTASLAAKHVPPGSGLIDLGAGAR